MTAMRKSARGFATVVLRRKRAQLLTWKERVRGISAGEREQAGPRLKAGVTEGGAGSGKERSRRCEGGPTSQAVGGCPPPRCRHPGLDPGSRFFCSSAMRTDGQGGWVYIMADRYRGAMYVGVTADLTGRVHQHRSGGGSDFCRRYGLDRLVWAEPGECITDCIAHEKRLKRWRREWKFALIERGNPEWRDLFELLV